MTHTHKCLSNLAFESVSKVELVDACLGDIEKSYRLTWLINNRASILNAVMHIQTIRILLINIYILLHLI